jgi:hypothetical protein
MASIISAGTTSGTALNMTADTTGALQLATNSGTTAVTIDTSQNVGIGTTSISYKLQVNGNVNNTSLFKSTNATSTTPFANLIAGFSSAGSGADTTLVLTDATLYNSYIGAGGGNLYFATNGTTERMRIDSSGNVGIGTASPTSKLSVAGEIRSLDGTVSTYITSASGAGGYLGTRSNDYLSFQTNSTDRMRIDTSGNLFLGQTAYTTPPTQTVDFFSGGLIINPTRRTTGSAANCFWNSADGVFYRSTSSLRYKTDVQDAIHGLSDVLKLRPITYKGKSETDEGKIFGGFLAEEVDEIGLKEFVEYDVDNKPDSLAYGNMVSLLTKAIQEQQTIINDLKARIETLEGAKL